MTSEYEDSHTIRYVAENKTYHLSYDMECPGELSSALVRAISVAADVDPMELESLYNRIDLEVLEELFTPMSDGTRRDHAGAWFSIRGCTVIVTGEGEVAVYSPGSIPNFVRESAESAAGDSDTDELAFLLAEFIE